MPCGILTVSMHLVLQFTPEEITAIMNDFAEPGSLAPTGLFIGGVKYMVIQGEPGAVIRGKKVIYISWCIIIDLVLVSPTGNLHGNLASFVKEETT